MHDIAVDVGQAEVAAIVAEGEPLMIQAQQVKDRTGERRRLMVNSMDDVDWSDWYPFEGEEIGFQAPSDKGGVYCIADSRENLVYVGEAESLLERLAEHENGSSDQSACIRNSGGKFFRFIVIENAEERESFEGVLIQLVATPCNH